ncbi:MAG TPA: ATP-binding protein [Pyrinomonadaceae bacterium]|nr:ATP-binding protein [Pyrinomonadaceae bacterium]
MIPDESVYQELAQARDLIGTLQEELAETNRGLMALAMELEDRVAVRTKELRLAQEELRQSNSDLVQLTQELEDRVSERTKELQLKSAEVQVMSQQLWQAARLATMGELAASVAHELNNPLATLALRSELVLEKLPPEDPNRPSLEVISKEVDRMANLVSNLLQFSRRNQPQTSNIDVPKEVHDSLELFHHLVRGRNIEVVTEFAGDLPTIEADRQKLRQLFLNLLTNATDAMPKGGKLVVRASRGQHDENEAVVLQFVDTGTGIPPEHIDHIWDTFFTTKPEGKGTGLGLAICRRVVEEHSGTITIDSETGNGTTVTISLPARQTDAMKVISTNDERM